MKIGGAFHHRVNLKYSLSSFSLRLYSSRLPWRRFLHNGFGVLKQIALLALLDFLEDVGMTVNVSENFTQRFRCDLI